MSTIFNATLNKRLITILGKKLSNRQFVFREITEHRITFLSLSL
jgi:hypothetical protein